MNESIADQLGSLAAPNPSATVLVEMADLEAGPTALCQPPRDPTAEAHRRATLHDVLDASRALAGALEEFARAGGAHYRGVHCTSHMQAEMQRLAQRLSAWSDAILSAGTAQREWQVGAAGPTERPRGDLERRLADAFPGLAVQTTVPVQVSPI
jgi:hypothetical protein